MSGVIVVCLTVFMPNGDAAEADSKHSCIARNSKHAQGPDHQSNLQTGRDSSRLLLQNCVPAWRGRQRPCLLWLHPAAMSIAAAGTAAGQQYQQHEVRGFRRAMCVHGMLLRQGICFLAGQRSSSSLTMLLLQRLSLLPV